MSLSKPGPESERESCTDRNNEPKMAASQSSRKKRDSQSVNHCRHSALVDWCELMRGPSEAGLTPISSSELEWAAGLSSGSLRPPSLLPQDLKAELGGWARVHDKCDTKSHWILNRLLISSCFHPSVLALSI